MIPEIKCEELIKLIETIKKKAFKINIVKNRAQSNCEEYTLDVKGLNAVARYVSDQFIAKKILNEFLQREDLSDEEKLEITKKWANT